MNIVLNLIKWWAILCGLISLHATSTIPKRLQKLVSSGVGQSLNLNPPASLNFLSLAASAPDSLVQIQDASLEYSQFLKSFGYTVQENSLLYKSWAIYSQWGEEGILDEILTRLNIENGFFVEFGGWDACHLSNTRFLAERGWGGAFIEADHELHNEAVKNCKYFPTVQALCEFVTDKTSSKGKTLDQIASEHFPGQEIDVLSIDIDGADYLILEKLKCRPKIIVIEGGISWHPLVTKRMPDLVAKNQLNQPLAVIFKIADKAGYTPVCFTINSFLIRNDLAAPFKDIKNDAVTLWFDSWHYYLDKYPAISSYVREVRATDPWILQYDHYELP